jgi:hypothetical protein
MRTHLLSLFWMTRVQIMISPIPSFYNPLILDEPESAGESMASA